MNITITRSGKTVAFPVEITSKYITDALRSAKPRFPDVFGNEAHLYPVKLAFDNLKNWFPTLSTIKAGLFTKDYIPQPSMLENELAVGSPDLLDYYYKRKRPFYHITSKGLDFLDLVIWSMAGYRF
jgi:hypothetical protein